MSLDTVDTGLVAAEPGAGADGSSGVAAHTLDPFLDIALDPLILSWERYELGELLGQGGMGCVYRARDRRLDRDVALKFLRRGDPELVRRFLREARSQAQVDHPHVCRVYEVGEIGSHVYIAMQLVKGHGLMEAGLSMGLGDKVAVAADVARAVEAAHSRNLIHRDLKPANVMVELRGGGWHAYVLDFGIAREEHRRDVTETGTVMGTLAYLSPEQARGAVAELDRRSDVYGLGATFYALLAGCAPFPQSAGPEIIWKVVHEEPRPLRRRDPDIPADLETVVMKCLEKDPSRRYPTAAELAADLDRFRRGEPILARPASLVYRLGKRVRRQRAATAMLAAGSLVVVAALGFSLHQVRLAASRSELARRLAAEVEELEGAARVEAMLPPHDRSAERAATRARLERILREAERVGEPAKGPADHALGHGFVLLGDNEAALEHLRAAWRAGYDDPADAAALGRVYAALYRKGVDDLNQVADPELRRSRRREIERRYLKPALAHLRLARAGGAPAEGEALVALLEERYQDALAAAEDAFARTPWLYEAKQLAAEIHLRLAQERLDQGDHAAAGEKATRAGEALAAALAVARSDAGLLETEAARWLLEMDVARRTGGPLRDPFARALAAATAALSINPESVRARNSLSTAHLRLAEHLYYRGEDPTANLLAATAAAREAVALAPGDLRAHHNLACALSFAAVREADLGRDPRASFEQAVASFQKALELSPAFAPALDDLGYTLERKAKHELQRGLDPSSSLDQAIAAYRGELRLSPSFANAHNNLGIALLRRATYQALVGQDPTGAFAEAAASLKRATQLNPNYAFAYANLGIVHRTRAANLLEQGQDPSAELDLARAAFARAAAIDNAVSWSYPELAAAELTAARWAAQSGGDPGPCLGHAEQAITAAIRLNPRSAAAFQRGAELELERARWAAAHRRNAATQVARGLAQVDRAIALNPNLAEVILTRVALLGEQARGERGAAARKRLLDRATAELDRARSLNPLLKRDCASVAANLNKVAR